MALDMACEIESIQIDTSIMWVRWQANIRATSGDIDRPQHSPRGPWIRNELLSPVYGRAWRWLLAHGPLVNKPFTHAFTLQCFSHVQVPQYYVFGLVG
jgi:hypothetical protein